MHEQDYSNSNCNFQVWPFNWIYSYPSHLRSDGQAIVQRHHSFQGIEPEQEKCSSSNSSPHAGFDLSMRKKRLHESTWEKGGRPAPPALKIPRTYSVRSHAGNERKKKDQNIVIGKQLAPFPRPNVILRRACRIRLKEGGMYCTIGMIVSRIGPVIHKCRGLAQIDWIGGTKSGRRFSVQLNCRTSSRAISLTPLLLYGRSNAEHRRFSREQAEL